MPHSKGWRRRSDRRSTSEVPLGVVLDELLREPVFARGAPIGRLAASWAEVVGPRLASETAPASLEQGVLVVAATSGPWGAQARFLAEEIRRRANEALGEELVGRVQVVVRPEARKPL
jgi:predicted nucleic acid-binding Zn ribbon protein